MKIFVGYGFHPRDAWIPDLIFPLIEAFGSEAVDGGELQGQEISNGVRTQIERCSALIGFLTRRDPMAADKWTTHTWVEHELAHAQAKELRLLEVRETGIDPQRGMFGNRQPITYAEDQRDRCIVEVAKVLGRWHSLSTVRLKLLPKECSEELFPLHRSAELTCNYNIMVEGDVEPPRAGRFIPLAGGLSVEAKDVPRRALIQLHIKYRDKNWISNFESTDLLDINLRKDIV